ncbi:MAG: hypothetical protein ACOX64_07635 [Candidatus Merdivicinus sp.]
MFFSLISGISNVIFFTVLGLISYGSLPGFSVFPMLMALALAVISVAATFVSMMVMKYGDMSIYTMFMMLGGMILSSLAAPSFSARPAQESFSRKKTAGSP